MVFKKDIMIKFCFLLTSLFLLGGCTYQYVDTHDIDIENIKKIYLNVKSFEIGKENLKITKTDDLLYNEINNKVLKNIESWAWKKFTVKGKQNVAYLNLLKIETHSKDKIKNKKSIISIMEQEKEIYNISLNFDLSIADNQSSNKTLKIFSNLDFVLLDKYSISQRGKVITYNINKLIKLIDEKVNNQLNKNTFKKFVINNFI